MLNQVSLVGIVQFTIPISTAYERFSATDGMGRVGKLRLALPSVFVACVVGYLRRIWPTAV
jgi:hypothetical protein